MVVPNALLHLASRMEPELIFDSDGLIHLVVAEWIRDAAYGDTPGFIRWPEVTAITWRWSE